MNSNMRPERIGVRITDLRKKHGWKGDAVPQSIHKAFEFESYSDAMTFLIEVGSLAETTGAVPNISIEDGTKVTLRLGQPVVSSVTVADVAFAEALASI